MPASVGYLVIDTTDPGLLTPFWCGLLEVDVDATIGDGQFVVLSPTKDGLTIGFQRVPEAKAGRNRLHLDLIVEDLDTATVEVEGLGGRWLEPGNTLAPSSGASSSESGVRDRPMRSEVEPGVSQASLVAILHAPRTVHTTSQAAITATATAVDSGTKYDESRSPPGPFTIM